VYDQLPEKVRAIVPIPVVDRQEYEEALEELRELLREKYDTAATLVEIEKLKQMASGAKWKQPLTGSGIFSIQKRSSSCLLTTNLWLMR
jgi:hypothetical protein